MEVGKVEIIFTFISLPCIFFTILPKRGPRKLKNIPSNTARHNAINAICL